MDRRLSVPAHRGATALTRRRIAWLLLVTVVALLHLAATYELAERMAEFDLANAMPKRIEVAYLRTIEPERAVAAAPVPVAKQTAPKVRRPAKAASASAATKVAAAEASASAAEAPASAIEPVPALATADAALAPASAPDESDRRLAGASKAASAARAGTPAASGVASFEWPGATRVSYLLTGNYRGEVSGSAQVEWIRIDDRYQVNLDLVVGAEFAPIIRRRMTSEGTIAPSGLVPERYDEDTEMVMRERRRMSVVFENDAVILANGERRERLAGVQDTASQFIQLTYMFSIQPELLRVGNVVGFPLALPRTMDNYAYEVVDDEQLVTPFGTVGAFHLKPRPQLPRRPNQLTAELWIAPELRFLPIRIRIEQDAATYIDLMIAKKPEIAAADPTAAPRVASTRRTP